MEPFLAALIIIPMIALARHFAHSQNDSTNRAWEALAERVDGSFTPGTVSWVNSETPEVTARIDGIDLVLDSIARGGGKSRRWYTRLRARAARAGDKELKVYERGLLTGFGRALGLQDVPLGDTSFDEDYVVKAGEPDFARVWVNRRVRERIRRAVGFRFVLARGQVTAELDGVENHVDLLEAGMKAAAAFADGRHDVLARFRKLERELGGSLRKRGKHWAQLAPTVDGTTLEISHHGDVVVVTAPVVGSKIEPFSLRRHVGTEDADFIEDYRLARGQADEVRASFGEAARGLLIASDAARVDVADDEVRVQATGRCPSTRRLLAAVRLASMLASGAQRAAYR
jgi:hypothetical protein